MSSITSTREIALLALAVAALCRTQILLASKKFGTWDAILTVIYLGVFVASTVAWLFSW